MKHNVGGHEQHVDGAAVVGEEIYGACSHSASRVRMCDSLSSIGYGSM
jgi:hypothetical protein